MTDPLTIEVDGTRTTLVQGRTYRVGGSPDCEIRLPDSAAPAPVLARIRHLHHWTVGGFPGGARIWLGDAEVTGAVVHLRDVPDGTDLVISTPAGRARLHILRGAPQPEVRVPRPRADEGAGSVSRTHRLGEVTVIGREDADAGSHEHRIAIPGWGVAVEHATLKHVAPGQYHLRDGGRGNGTFVDGRAVSWARITPGMSFSVGRSRFTLVRDGELRERRFATAATLSVRRLSAEHGGGPALRDLSFTAGPGEVLAVLGPSGAGKSSLFKALLGELRVTHGRVTLQGLDSRTDFDQLRLLLGFVPQDDDLHRTLTARQVLDYAARLRLASDTGSARRRAHVEAVCEELGIADRLDVRVERLSGGQRKRVSLALEILGDPSLLMLDEPTSGLDAGAAREVMRTLRGIADRGRTVVLVTHSTDQLVGVDKVLVMAPGGRPVFFGPPGEVLAAFDAPDFPSLMARIGSAPDTVPDAPRTPSDPDTRPDDAGQATAPADTPSAGPAAEAKRRPGGRPLRRTAVLVRRELALLHARGPAALAGLMTLAVLCGGFAALVASDQGLGGTGPDNPKALQALNLLVIGAVLCGQALTYSNVVAEFPIIRREFRTGVSPGPVIASKFLVHTLVGTAQAGVSVAVFRCVRPGPTPAFGLDATTMTALPLVGTVVCSMALGLLISATADRLERAVTLATVASVCQVALNGVPFALEAPGPSYWAAMPVPGRWGLAAAAALTDVRRLAPDAAADSLWEHIGRQVLIDLGMLALLTAVFVWASWLVLRRRLRPL
ncbi:ATP-binding cassette domain-containing protein [Streptomyces antibioticus]|uniref:ATP-binding cassette domain-containing protein n=1 Tax=Streptomyces antibioticus TaxID=1890 RepID=UPI00225AF608|nr:ATP-binding cassette domain-containing protein [Streptomyces antibioticus]MCX5172579.1 ATP-binding cassette domain-containing protein [Streptomyces antibioticus]